MRFDSANCTVLLDEKKRGTIVCDVEGVADDSRVSFAPEALIKAKGRLMAGKKKRKKKGKQTFCEGVMKSCRKRGKSKTPFCKSALKSCRKKARKGAKRRRKSKR